MDISMNEINSLTLNYFINKTQYGSVLERNHKVIDSDFNADKKFYKKLVLDLNKRLFRDEVNDTQLVAHFNNYVRYCISHLKMVDTVDIMQKQYDTLTPSIKPEELVEDASINIVNVDMSNYDYLFTKSDNTKTVNLDTFVIKTKTKETPKILPKKQNVNLNSKKFKTKGLEKKKNISNKYEDINEQTCV